MKPVFEQIPDRESESFWYETIQGPGFGCTWHFHPEYELTLTLRGRGHRIVGDHYATLEPGDLVLVGANLPHIWQNDSGTDVHAIVIQFRNDFLGKDFLDHPELAPVRRLLARSRSGLKVAGRTRQRVADRRNWGTRAATTGCSTSFGYWDRSHVRGNSFRWPVKGSKGKRITATKNA